MQVKKVFGKLLNYLHDNPIIFYIIFFFGLTLSYTPLGLFDRTIGGIIYRVILILILSPYILFYIKKNFNLLPKPLLIVALSFVLYSLINLFTLSLKIDFKMIFTNYFLSIVDIFTIFISSLMLCIDIKRGCLNYKWLYAILGFGIFLILFSLIADRQSIFNLFTKYDHSNYDIKSIFVDKNTFGLVLFLTSFASVVLSLKKSFLFLIPQLIFTFYLLLIRCKTAALLSLLLSLFLVGYYAFCQFKNKNKTGIIIIISSIILFTCLLVLTICKVSFFKNIYSVIFDKYGLIDDSLTVVADRFSIWSNTAKNNLTAITLLFGFGQRIAYLVIGRPIDNVYFYNLLNGGFIELIMYLVWIGFIGFTFKKNSTKKSFNIFLLVFISIILYGFMEDFGLWGFSFPSICFYLCIFATKCLEGNESISLNKISTNTLDA